MKSSSVDLLRALATLAIKNFGAAIDKFLHKPNEAFVEEDDDTLMIQRSGSDPLEKMPPDSKNIESSFPH